jgi:SNARE protein
VGTETAVKLQGQTEQMEKIVEDLDQIHFSLKKARVLVRDIVRQLATDKCIMAFLGLIAIGVVAIIMFKVFKPDKSSGPAPPGSEVVSTDNRRLLAVHEHIPNPHLRLPFRNLSGKMRTPCGSSR